MFTQPGTGFTIWLTGMQGAGKTTLAKALVERLRRMEKPVEFFEGPEWEQFIGVGPGETKDERNTLTRRAGFVAKAITRAGGFAVIAQVSPYRELREQLRREIGRFLEVYVDCPIETLLARDSSGQYLKAMKGEIRNFIGVTDPYEPPAAPEVRWDSSKQSPEEGVQAIMEALVREGALTTADAGLSRTPAKKEKPRRGKVPESIIFTPEMLKALPPRPPAPPPPPKAAKNGKGAPPAPVPAKAAKKAEIKPAPKPAPAPVKAEKPAKAEKKVPAAKTAAPPKAKAPAAKAAPAKAKPAKAAAPAKAAKKPAPAPKPTARRPAPAKKAAARPAGKSVKPAPKIAARTARAKAKGKR